MSFSNQQKAEIINQNYKSACCRRSLLLGFLSPKASFVENEVNFNLGFADAEPIIAKLILEFFGRRIEQKKATLGGRGKILAFESEACASYLSGFSSEELPFLQKCPFCRASFLRGFFLSVGRICDPQNQYLLEFSPKNNAEYFLDLLSRFGLELKLHKRRAENVIYTKNSGIIEDFFAIASMNSAAFSFINAKIEGEIRNNANRVANCDANNIGKSVNASHTILEKIKQLERHGLLSSLPEELEKTAMLRLKFESLSLSALAKQSVPPISKSGLSHRLARIAELCDQMLKGKN